MKAYLILTEQIDWIEEGPLVGAENSVTLLQANPFPVPKIVPKAH